jgi:hypothetical protein
MEDVYCVKKKIANQTEKSTTTAVHKVVTYIESAGDHKEIALMAFTDRGRAFCRLI